MSNILLTGSRGFISGYVIDELLRKDHFVVGIDNDWKYGKQIKSFDSNKKYKHICGDVKDVNLLTNALSLYKIDYLIASAALIGGITFFHKLAYDLLAENERICAATFDAAIEAFNKGTLKKIIAISSSMVFENTKVYPSKETDVLDCPAPNSTYGFQKLAVEYFCKGAYEQYKLPYTIVRPFNAVGVGEKRALLDDEVLSGNIKLAFSHVVPDLIQKIYKGQDPLHILGAGNQIRHYTYGDDVAKGIVECIFNPAALNESFNISTNISTTVLELAEKIWKKLNPNKQFKYITDDPFQYDVQKRIPSVHKAKELLNFETKTTLDEMLDNVIPWVCRMVDRGEI